jgi:hypothetical protein
MEEPTEAETNLENMIFEELSKVELSFEQRAELNGYSIVGNQLT